MSVRRFPDWWPEWDPIDVGLLRAWLELRDSRCPLCGKVHDSHDWPETGWVTEWRECPEAAARAAARRRFDQQHDQTPEQLGYLQVTYRDGWPSPDLRWDEGS
jgi:hypothetical protein